jgi:hypothetical protein
MGSTMAVEAIAPYGQGITVSDGNGKVDVLPRGYDFGCEIVTTWYEPNATHVLGKCCCTTLMLNSV